MFFKRPSKDKSVPASAPTTEIPKAEASKSVSKTGVPEPLLASDLRVVIDAKSLGFKTTAELKPTDTLIGQERALKALEFGLAIPGAEFNVFVLGPPSSGRRTSVKAALTRTAKDREAPSDWVYVHNFADPDRPKALKLPRGQGRKLQAAMAAAMDELNVTLPAAFDSEEYRARLTAIDEQYHASQSDVIEALHQRAAAQNIAIVKTPLGFGMAPMHSGKVVKPEVFNQLPDNMRREVEARIGSLQKELEANLAEAPAANRLRRQHMADLDEDFARAAVEAALDDASTQFAELAEVSAYLAAAEDDLVGNAGANRDTLRNGGEAAANLLRRYAVNVVVAHEDQKGAPIVEEPNPTLSSLMGRIEHVSEQGALVQDFTQIKRGALHRANGGYLVVDAAQLTFAPAAWSWLKRSLASGAIAIEHAGEPTVTGLARTIAPEPIPLDVKVILIGDRDLYQSLTQGDPEFARLFKVQAEFDDAVVRGKEADKHYARLVASVVAAHKLKPIEAAGVARLMEEAARLAEDRDRLSLDVGRMADIAREADHCATDAKHDSIKRDDVLRAIEGFAGRAARPRDRAQDSVTRGIVLVDTDGDKIGQINGLSLLEDGLISYGRPSRITARVHVGQGRVTDIEREAQLGGALHSKGVMILWGYLAGRFAQDSPLSLAASLVFEQSYATVEGDSAASAELYALLSALAEAPIRQGLAVTGSVNQCGDVQAVGGINEKIEGFFDLCKARGLTGTQGVLIPRANVQNLMLREDVVEAAKEKKFSIYAVSTIDEGIALLTGVAAGERQANGSYPAASINGRVQARLKAYADKARYFNGGSGENRLMIAHVAEAGEDRGRVVLHIGAGRQIADAAIDAAVRVARAYQSEIETLVVEDQQLVDFASFSFACETSLSGRTSRPLSAADMEQALRLQSAALHRRVAMVARAADVRARARVVREDALPALAKACAERGPWNVVTLGRMLDAESSDELQELFHGVDGTTGFVVTGPKAQCIEGPVIAIIEDLERVPPMLRAAERLASATGGQARLWLVASDADELEWMDGQARLALGLAAPATIEGFVVDSGDVDGAADTLAGLVKEQAAEFVVARFGGRLAPEFCNPGRPAALLECPLFLVR